MVVAKVAMAANEGLVPCGNTVNDKGVITDPCTWPHLYVLVGKIINFMLYGLAIPLAILLIIWGGIKYVASPVAAGGVKAARDTIQTAVIGLAISLGAWVILSTVIQALCISSGPGESKFTLKLWQTVSQCQSKINPQIPQ